VLATGSAFATVPLDDGPVPQNGPLPAAACANLMPTIVGAGFIVGGNGPDVILGSDGPTRSSPWAATMWSSGWATTT